MDNMLPKWKLNHLAYKIITVLLFYCTLHRNKYKATQPTSQKLFNYLRWAQLSMNECSGIAKTRKDHGYQVCFIQTCGCLSGPCRSPCGRCNRRPAPHPRSEVRNVACHRSTCGLSAPLPRQPTVKHHPSQNRTRLFRHTGTNYGGRMGELMRECWENYRRFFNLKG